MSGYRRGALRCPGCGEVMAGTAAGEAHLDVCPSCRGVWVDWHDGDVEAVVGTLGPWPAGKGAGAREGTCPVCATALHEERSLAAPILRCGDCVGAFVPGDSVARLVAVEESQEDAIPLLTRLLDRVARLLTPG